MESFDNCCGIFFFVVYYVVWVSIESVCSDGFISLSVDGFDSMDGSVGDVVYVEDGRVGIGVVGVEWVVVMYSYFCEGRKVVCVYGFFYEFYVGGDDFGDVFLEEFRGCDGLLYVWVRGNIFFSCIDDKD